MPQEYLTDGELGFLGLNSRDNPATLPKGYVAKAVNMRLEKGVATTRKGLKKFFDAGVQGDGKKIVGTGVYVNSTGQDSIVILVDDAVAELTKIVIFSTTASTFSTGPTLPVRITSSEGVEIVHALNAIYITRGHDNRPLKWDLSSTPYEIGENDEFPNCSGLMFYQNRLIAIGKHLQMDDDRVRDTICVSHFLKDDKWPILDCFTINQGGNDEIIATVPWTLNEFIILCRNSTFYLNTGSERYSTNDALSSSARLETLSVDVGCAARKSAVQVGEGVMFLSDNGVYFMAPTSAGRPDGVKLLTLSDPVSAPIDDVIERINKDAIAESIGAYWNNRYYLAVPLDDSVVNNAILVYNFILKAWESVDIYPSQVDFLNFVVGKRVKQRRLFAIDPNEGVLLLEESANDELGARVGTPTLGTESARLSWTLSSEGFGNSSAVEGELVTRRFTADEGKDKRFSSIESDFFLPAGAIIETTAITTNSDTETVIDTFQHSQASVDTTRRNPVRKIAYGLQIKFRTLRLQPSIRSNYIKFTMSGKNNINSK